MIEQEHMLYLEQRRKEQWKRAVASLLEAKKWLEEINNGKIIHG